jgi:hypothetical protein
MARSVAAEHAVRRRRGGFDGADKMNSGSFKFLIFSFKLKIQRSAEQCSAFQTMTAPTRRVPPTKNLKLKIQN